MHLTCKVLALVTSGALLASAATAAEARTLNFATPAPPTERRANETRRRASVRGWPILPQ